MRGSSAAPIYAPSAAPLDSAQLPRFITQELQKVAAALSLVGSYMQTTYVAPDKPRDGLTLLADGTHWNPGAGQGVYTYYAAAWHKLG